MRYQFHQRTLQFKLQMNLKPAHNQNIISCLNRLQSITQKIHKHPKIKQEIQDDICFLSSSLKQYLKAIKITTAILNNQEQKIQRLNQEKNKMTQKHSEVLEALEMLVYQGDIQYLKDKIDHYKNKPLDQSYLTFITQNLTQRSSNQSLNKAFIEEEKGFSQFENFEENSAKKMVQQELEKVQLQAALRMVADEEEPFEKKQEAWLGIVFTKNAKEESDVFNSGRITSCMSTQYLQNLSGISITEQYEVKSKESQKEMFSGKKIKSMTFLKEKSSKKKSVPKTSIKKAQTHRQMQNVQLSDEKVLRRKLNFVNKQASKKKNPKNQQALTSKSHKKQIPVN